MRHKVAGRRLNMPADQRKALLKGLVSNLIINEGIVTTEQKATEAKETYVNQRKIIFEKFASIFGNYTLSEAKKIYQDGLIKLS